MPRAIPEAAITVWANLFEPQRLFAGNLFLVQGGSIGIGKDTSSTGFGVLANYAIPNSSWNLSARIENISSSGSPTDGSANLLYGPGSKAWSATFTPTYQVGIFFARAEISYVGASSTTPGFAFGKNGNNTSQTRFAIETGILF